MAPVSRIHKERWVGFGINEDSLQAREVKWVRQPADVEAKTRIPDHVTEPLGGIRQRLRTYKQRAVLHMMKGAYVALDSLCEGVYGCLENRVPTGEAGGRVAEQQPLGCFKPGCKNELGGDKPLAPAEHTFRLYGGYRRIEYDPLPQSRAEV
jgi:hypothetical protein